MGLLGRMNNETEEGQLYSGALGFIQQEIPLEFWLVSLNFEGLTCFRFLKYPLNWSCYITLLY